MTNARRFLRAIAAGAVLAAIAAGASTLLARPVQAATVSAQAQAQVKTQTRTQARSSPMARHVVIVGIAGLRWDQVSAAAEPTLWRLASAGSAGGLVDYAEHPLACPADAWLTLNSGARAQGTGACGSLPAVYPVGSGAGAAIPAMPGIVAANRGFHQDPDWGLLGRLPGCATAVGPGAALALAAPSGAVPDYLSSPRELSAAVLARCPLTVVDLGTHTVDTERPVASAPDKALARIVGDLSPDTMLLVTAVGTTDTTPHLMALFVSGPGYGTGLLRTASTRQPGIVALTDLTPTVAHWLGASVPASLPGSVVGRAERGNRNSLAATVRTLTGRDAAEQTWISTHAWFLAGYGGADVLAFGIPALVWRGASDRRRRRRAACWRVAGIFAAAVPVSTFLAALVPWWQQADPAAWLYGLAAVWTLIVGAAALLADRKKWWSGGRIPGAFGAICLLTLIVLGVDVMTGSRLQLETPFGLSLLTSGRYYGIGNDAVGVYCVSALVAAGWAGGLVRAGRRRLAVAVAAVIGLFAVGAAGWPGFGAKVGGTIALVPCLLLLLSALAGIRPRWRWAVPVALSGLFVFAVFGLITYFVPAAGVSDIGSFAGNLLHGSGGAVLERKAGSNVATLTESAVAPLVPVAVVLAGLMLWRPSWFRLRTLPRALAARPLLRVTAWLVWLVLVLGWLADDSGVIVPAAAAPFGFPLVIAAASAVFYADIAPITSTKGSPACSTSSPSS